MDRHVGAGVRERRLTLGLTLRHLAEALGTTYQQVRKYERGMTGSAPGGCTRSGSAGYFFEGLGAGEAPLSATRQRRMFELARNLTALPRRQQEALAGLARTLAGAEPEEAGEGAGYRLRPALPRPEGAERGSAAEPRG